MVHKPIKFYVMKKLFLFLSIFLVALNFNSCTNDDDDDTPDKIVGKWRLSQIFVKVNQEFENYMPTECEKKSTLEFFENGTYKENDFEFNDETNICEDLGTINGTWENLGNSLYNISGIDIPEITLELQVKVTFEGSKMIMEISGTMDFEGEEFDILVKVTFIDNDDFIPDSVIGKWRLDQAFYNNAQENLSDCEKTMTIQFFEEGTYQEKDFELNDALQCIALEVKNGTWKNLGNDMYEKSDLEVPELKITFANNKMTVEFTGNENGETFPVKLVFVKATV